jgi:hypothetical protein
MGKEGIITVAEDENDHRIEQKERSFHQEFHYWQEDHIK